MKIAIIGAGFTGLAAAYTLLKEHHHVTIFEKEPQPGGLALGFQEKGWEWTLEEYYHHWFTNDHNILNLAKELHYPVVIKRPKTSSYIDGKIYQLDSALSLITFSKLSLLERVRMGIVLGFLRFNPYWQPLEKIKAASYLRKAMGKKTFELIWEPLLVNKFGHYYDEISLAWFWARIKKRTPQLAYPTGGFLAFAQTLAADIQKRGGKILYKTSIDKIIPIDNKLSLGKAYGVFDKVIVTLPSFAFAKLCPQLPDTYADNLKALRGLGAITLVLRLKKRFLSDGTYWLNICQKNAPVLAIVEHTNFMDKKYYNNEHLVYLGNYLPHYHPYFFMTKQQLLETYDPFLKKIYPSYEKNLLGTELFTVPFAQPIIPINYSKMIPAFETPIKNVYLANMQQVYPWDRGTNYAVALGEKVAKLIISH